MTFCPTMCDQCGWVGTSDGKETGPTILLTCARCGHVWRIPRPIEVKVCQHTLEGWE